MRLINYLLAPVRMVGKCVKQAAKVIVATMIIRNAEKLTNRQTEAICRMMR